MEEMISLSFSLSLSLSLPSPSVSQGKGKIDDNRRMGPGKEGVGGKVQGEAKTTQTRTVGLWPATCLRSEKERWDGKSPSHWMIMPNPLDRPWWT